VKAPRRPRRSPKKKAHSSPEGGSPPPGSALGVAAPIPDNASTDFSSESVTSPESAKDESTAERWSRRAEEAQKETQKLAKKLHPAELEDRRAWANYVGRASVEYLPGDFPLELIANIACRLLRGEDYADAAVRALKLVRECDHQLKQLKDARQSLNAAFQNATDLSSDYDVPQGVYQKSFHDAIRTITGQGRRDRAESDYLSFLQATNPSANASELNSICKEQELNGIDAAVVRKLSAQFAKLRSEGKLDKRRWPKKVLDDTKSPEM